MRILILWSLLFLSLGAEDLKVMSFNIRYQNNGDGLNHWMLRRTLVIKTAQDFKPDIIGFQEVLKGQMDYLKNAFKDSHESFGVGRDDGKTRGEYSPVFYDKKKFEKLKATTYWLSDTPNKPGSKSWGNGITRICTYISLKEKKSGKVIHVFNTHWDHRSDPSRVKAGEFIRKKTAGLKYVIIMGDFNTAPNSKAIENLTAQKENHPVLKDTYKEKFKDEKDAGTFNGFKGRKSGARIDMVFCSDDFKVDSAKIHHDNLKGRYPSDHFPVSAVLKWQK